jgi:SNF2 family DNA or RNA helicase
MVARELPPKTEIEHAVELTGGQRDLYETVRASMERRVREALQQRGLARSHIVVLDALLKLRQVCCDPRLVAGPTARKVKESAKLERLAELLPELVAEGRRVLLFSQFTSMLALIEERLAALDIDYVKLTGETKDRKTPVARFQGGEVPLFLVSLKAGGTGLNLTAADTVIHYDPWWNPAVENQATDRAHRIGKDKPVFVHRLIAAGTVEERIRALQARKADLARGILDEDAAVAKVLTAQDMQALFEPLSA